MLNRRWLGIAVFLVAAGVAAIVLFESTTPKPELPRLRVPDAGVVAIVPPRSSFMTAGAPFPTAVVTPTLGQACVTGTVVDASTGLAVANAVVTLQTFAGQRQATTDDFGTFEFRKLTEGTVRVVALEAEGYLEHAPNTELHLVDGVCVSTLTLSLVPRVEYLGEVVGPDDGPIAGAHVVLATEREPAGAPLVTDAHGQFRFFAPEDAIVTASHPGFVTRSVQVDFKVAATRSLLLRLEKLPPDASTPSTTIRGVVLDEHDAGVEAVVLIWREVGSARAAERNVSTNADGTFTFTTAPGSFGLMARADGHGSAPVLTTGGEVVLRLVPDATLQGAVRDEQGAPVPMFSVLLQWKQGALETTGARAHHVVDTDGAFVIAPVTTGTLEVVVAAAGFAPSTPQVVELAPGETRSLEFTLGRGVQVLGSVVSRGSRSPLRGARVSLERSADDTALPLARCDENGRFALLGLTPGRRSLFAEAEGHDARLLSLEVSSSGATGLVIDLTPVPDGGTPQLELVGIGAVLRADGDVLVIDQLVPRAGGDLAGLAEGERIISIDGVTVTSLGFAGSVERLRGAEDTTVVVEVRQASGLTRRVVVTRRRVGR